MVNDRVNGMVNDMVNHGTQSDVLLPLHLDEESNAGGSLLRGLPPASW